ncbi:MAG: hypothetical protein JNG83_12030 [Opitutaceae bacterium]|nr:hypothetical protein [Opitutaceae bacterium]
MKTFPACLRLLAFLSACCGLFSYSLAAEAKKETPKPVDLQVLVDVPPTWRPFLDDDIAEIFTSRLQEVFKRRGYAGNIVQVTNLYPGAKEIPTLEIFLSEWRIDRSGNAQCTFTAALKTAAGEKNLGIKSGTAMYWAQSRGRWSMQRAFETSDALEDAARDALRDLYVAVAKTGIVPGLDAAAK